MADPLSSSFCWTGRRNLERGLSI